MSSALATPSASIYIASLPIIADMRLVVEARCLIDGDERLAQPL
jgi:hypothetical protein